MNSTLDFITKYLKLYLNECRVGVPSCNEEIIDQPPTAEEVATLMQYLVMKQAAPIVIGSLATIKHLNISKEDIKAQTYRLTNRLEVLLQGSLPAPPDGWQKQENPQGLESWISPLGGRVDFFNVNDLFAENEEVGLHLNADDESFQVKCPIADIKTLFFINLESFFPRNLYDLQLITRTHGIPNGLDEILITPNQRKNLTFIRRWIKIHSVKN